MKAILVIDMPKNCHDCPCYHEGYGRCKITEKFIEDVGIVDSWCPLKPLPEKMEENLPNGREWTKAEILAYSHGINRGWNLCLEEIDE